MAVCFWYLVKKLLVQCTRVQLPTLDKSLFFKVPEKHSNVSGQVVISLPSPFMDVLLFLSVLSSASFRKRRQDMKKSQSMI